MLPMTLAHPGTASCPGDGLHLAARGAGRSQHSAKQPAIQARACGCRAPRVRHLTLSQGHARRGAVDLDVASFAEAQEAFLEASARPREVEDPAQVAARFGGQLAAPYSDEMRRLSAQWRSLARQPAVVHVTSSADSWADVACSSQSAHV